MAVSSHENEGPTICRWQITRRPSEPFVRIIASGPMTLPLFTQFLSEALTFASKEGVRLFLADSRRMTLDISVTRLYYFAGTLPSLGATPVHKAAILPPAFAPAKKNFEFLENRLVNCGYGVHLFQEPSEATAWLRACAR